MQTPYPKLADRRELNAATMPALPPLRLAPAAEMPRTAKAEAYDAMSDETLNEVFTVVAVKVVEVFDEYERHAYAMANTLPVRIAQAFSDAELDEIRNDPGENADRLIVRPGRVHGPIVPVPVTRETDGMDEHDAGGQA